jgi:hypothetical protein
VRIVFGEVIEMPDGRSLPDDITSIETAMAKLNEDFKYADER